MSKISKLQEKLLENVDSLHVAVHADNGPVGEHEKRINVPVIDGVAMHYNTS